VGARSGKGGVFLRWEWHVTRFRNDREGEERPAANERSVDFTKKGVYSFHTSPMKTTIAVLYGNPLD